LSAAKPIATHGFAMGFAALNPSYELFQRRRMVEPGALRLHAGPRPAASLSTSARGARCRALGRRDHTILIAASPPFAATAQFV